MKPSIFKSYLLDVSGVSRGYTLQDFRNHLVNATGMLEGGTFKLEVIGVDYYTGTKSTRYLLKYAGADVAAILPEGITAQQVD